MEDKDFEQIEKLFTRLSDDFGKKLELQSEDFHRWIGVQGDDLQHKLNLVVEGQQMLREAALADRANSPCGSALVSRK